MVAQPLPERGPQDLRIAVAACGVCRTDLHVADSDIRGTLPIITGYEIVGRVEGLGPGTKDFAIGDRVGVPWLGNSPGIIVEQSATRNAQAGASNVLTWHERRASANALLELPLRSTNHVLKSATVGTPLLHSA